jgi:hypothetical protein
MSAEGPTHLMDIQGYDNWLTNVPEPTKEEVEFDGYMDAMTQDEAVALAYDYMAEKRIWPCDFNNDQFENWLFERWRG